MDAISSVRNAIPATKSIDVKTELNMREQRKERKDSHESNSEKSTYQDQEISKEKLLQTVKGLNDFLSPVYTSVKFHVHEELDRLYVELVDRETDEVIREIPAKKLLDVYASMLDVMGLVVDEKI